MTYRPSLKFCERRFLRTGRVAHLFLDNSGDEALCGVKGQGKSGQDARTDFIWLGTGTQAEYEKAAALPICQGCRQRVREE